MLEIGGDFEIDDSMSDQANRTLESMTLLNDPAVYWYSSGRMALRAVLRTIRKGVFLVPSYLCESILWAFRQESVPFEFYPVSDGLRVDPRDIERLLRRDVSGLLYIEWFGLSASGDISNLLAELVHDGRCVINDVTHAFPGIKEMASRPASHVLCSVRKTLPIPDGAFVYTKKSSPARPHLDAASYVRQKFLAQVRKNLYLKGLGDRDFWPDLREAERGFDCDPEIRSVSEQTHAILGQTDLGLAVTRRKTNFTYLLSHVSNYCRSLRPLLYGLPDDGSPLGLPILTSQRDLLRDFLIAKGIYPPIHWVLPREAREWATQFNKTAIELSSRELTIPCDQRYDTSHMDYVIKQLDYFDEFSRG